ncbi:MAG: helix-turn-helix transcriptional regulator, partial [Geodermatophilales bacterium]|nr:helix-turn-helix transcriptional regulator [Geodermatophilales bacterium]
MSLLAALRMDGPSTATHLAERLGESSGSTSYHLRQLAAFGFVEEVPGEGDGRERWWRARHRSTRWDTGD